MAKKKKATKKRTAKKKPAPKPRRDPLPRHIGLQAKILKVMERLPVIECTGEEYDDKVQDTYYYTEASTVFRLYTGVFVEVGLTFVPIDIKIDKDEKFYKAVMTYRLTDVETDQYQDVKAVGLGCNGVWALNSAQTVGRKQALLNTFGASYPQPSNAKPKIRKIARGFDPNDVLTVEKAREELVAHDFFNKEKQNGKATDSQGGSGQSIPTGTATKENRSRRNDKAKIRGKQTRKPNRKSGK